MAISLLVSRPKTFVYNGIFFFNSPFYENLFKKDNPSLNCLDCIENQDFW